MPPFDAPPDGAYGPTVSDIVQKIECEVAAARDENDTPAFRAYLRDLGLADFSQWAAGKRYRRFESKLRFGVDLPAAIERSRY
jgi:hypothetical protein